MSEIVERVTLALCCGRVNPCPEGECCKAHTWEPEARRAIAAMREPTETMLRDGMDDVAEPKRMVDAVWRAMISAALKE